MLKYEPLQVLIETNVIKMRVPIQEKRLFFSNTFRPLFRDFIDATVGISLTKKEIIVQFQKRAHYPHLIAAGFDKVDVSIPWPRMKKLRPIFG